MPQSNNKSGKLTREDLFKAYERTCFIIDAAGREIHLRIGHQNPDADELLKEYGVTGAAFITAWNPGSVRLTTAENERRQQSMEEQIHFAGFQILHGRGVGIDPTWTPEESALIFGIPETCALALAGQFGQLAIVWHEVERQSILVAVSD